jgi:formylglycine-generating enzyme required for sulfatase activity
VSALGATKCSPFGAAPDTSGEDAGDAATTSDVETAADVAPTGNCPQASGGPPLVYVEGVCIDAWEITYGDFQPFVGKVPPVTLPPRCAGMPPILDPVAPGCGRPVTGPDEPATCITWCEAFAVCAAFGKHLCGHVGGGSVAPGDVASPALSEWARACTGNGTREYATGGPPPTACNVAKSVIGTGEGRALPHGRTPSCEGPRGVFDLPGNAMEWLDACGVGKDDKRCANGGDSYAFHGSNGNPGACAVQDSDSFDFRALDKGFRCCANPL